MPISRPYTTNRPQFTQCNKRQSQTWSSPRFTVLPSTHTTQATCQLVFQFRVDALNPVTNRQCATATCKTAMKPKWPTAPMHRTHANELVHKVPTNVPVVPSGRFRHFLSRQSRRSSNSTNTRSHNPLRGQLASKPVDVFGPSAPRTHRRTFALSQSPRRRGCRLRSPMCTPACCQPFGSGTVQRRAVVACRLRFTPRSAPDHWLLGEERARRMARRSDEYSAHSRCYSIQPHSTKTEESRITRCKKGTIIKGRPPFCHHQCSRTAARPRAALPRCNVQSTTHVPTT